MILDKISKIENKIAVISKIDKAKGKTWISISKNKRINFI